MADGLTSRTALFAILKNNFEDVYLIAFPYEFLQGIWKGTTNSTCEPITCLPLDEGVIGTSAGLLTVNPPACSEVPSKVKTKCKFSCPKGYKLAGPKVARCKKSGMWSLKGTT